MGDLARQRAARDMWISRGHVRAGMVGFALAVVLAFVAGMRFGSQGEVGGEARATFVDDATAGPALVELLARVDASDELDGGVGALTFPEQLMTPADGDVVPEGRFTIEVGRFGTLAPARALREHLRQAGLAAWVGVERAAGRTEYRVGVGGYPDEEPAEAAMTETADALAGYDGGQTAPRVVSL